MLFFQATTLRRRFNLSLRRAATNCWWCRGGGSAAAQRGFRASPSRRRPSARPSCNCCTTTTVSAKPPGTTQSPAAATRTRQVFSQPAGAHAHVHARAHRWEGDEVPGVGYQTVQLRRHAEETTRPGLSGLRCTGSAVVPAKWNKASLGQEAARRRRKPLQSPRCPPNKGEHRSLYRKQVNA